MKWCPECTAKLIHVPIKNHNMITSYCEMALAKTYVCSDRDICGIMFHYCIICRKIMESNSWIIHSEVCHNLGLCVNRSRHFYTRFEGGEMLPVYRFEMRSVYLSNLQVFLLNLLRCAIYDNRDMRDLPEREVKEICTDNIMNNDYECILCGLAYDSLPSERLVTKHLKLCKVAILVRDGVATISLSASCAGLCTVNMIE